jgi:MFS family permease
METLHRTPQSDALRQAWWLVALLVPVALLNYLDRQMLATMRGSVVADIPGMAQRSDWGLLLGCFKWTYACMSPFAGFLSDRWSKPRVILLSLFIWSGVTWATGHAHSYSEMLFLRALMGLSEAFYLPSALAFVAELHPDATRSRAIGLHQSGIYAGQILGGFTGYLADDPALGWRLGFTACGAAGMLYALPLWRFLRPAPLPLTPTAPEDSRHSDQHVAPSNAPRSQSSVLRQLLANRAFLLLVLYFTLPAIAGWVIRDWMPDILREKFGLGQGKAGVSAILVVQGASLLGVVAGGTLADRWMRRSSRGRIHASAVGTLLFLPALFCVGSAPTLSVAILGLAVFGLGWGFFDCNNMPILSQIVPPHARATAYGLMNFVSIGCGGLGDWLFGALRDAHVPLPWIFGTFAGVALLSVLIVLRIQTDPGGPTPNPAN